MFEFFKLEVGSNAVRILTAPWQYMCHAEYTLKGAPPHAQKLKCPSLVEGIECNICKGEQFEASVRPQPRWILGVHSYRRDRFVLLDLGFKEWSQLRELARHQKWGDPQKYDVDFCIRDDYEYPRCSVIPYPPEPFQGKAEAVDPIEYLKVITKPSLDDLAIINRGDFQKIKRDFDGDGR